jgi:hypothetical protein
MPLPIEVLDSVKEDIEQAKLLMKDLKDVIADMRYAGMDIAKQEEELASLSSEIKKLEVFYDRQKAKSPGATKAKAR